RRSFTAQERKSNARNVGNRSQAKLAFLYRPGAENERQKRGKPSGAKLAFLYRPGAENERQLSPGRGPGFFPLSPGRRTPEAALSRPGPGSSAAAGARRRSGSTPGGTGRPRPAAPGGGAPSRRRPRSRR